MREEHATQSSGPTTPVHLNTSASSVAFASARVGPASRSDFRPGGLAAWQTKRTLEFIETNLGSKMVIEDMANVISLSKSHFSRAFKHSVGTSPKAYVGVRRIELAKQMMTSTRERLTDIALACGFADQSHLNRYFRRVVGLSPGLWRRMSHVEAAPGRATGVLRHC